jgi:hypothetical protein
MDKEQRQQEWIARIEDYKASGLTAVHGAKLANNRFIS